MLLRSTVGLRAEAIMIALCYNGMTTEWWEDAYMSQIVEIDERGAIQLPADLLATVKPHTRFALERRGTTLILQPLAAAPFWVKATPAERAAAIRQWATLERPAAPPLSDGALSRDQIYD